MAARPFPPTVLQRFRAWGRVGRSLHVRAGTAASAALNWPAPRRWRRRNRRRQATLRPRQRWRPAATGAV